MKTALRGNAVAWVCACVLAAGFASPVFSAEKSAYEGEWTTQAPALSLKITAKDASFTINGKTYTDPTPEYFYGQLETAPFLYLQAEEPSGNPADAQNQHRLYLIIGENANGNEMKPSLHGYYDLAHLAKGQTGNVTSESWPIQMERAGNAPVVQVSPVKGG
ncbi:MAG: hypothetical protein PHE17_04210 [Thiothrix sp.]|uniref:hypothetical protein n=1 Tax=Thiothrix sp. TaxID=1032 RepID=UPI00261612F6|nr:hypothetical protein [Thiothrix sp.]MDD5392202.1 hypothetical protein [Thiothrix sp.]